MLPRPGFGRGSRESGYLFDVLVTTPTQANHDRTTPRPAWTFLQKTGYSVRALERWNNAFQSSQQRERVQRFLVRDASITRTTAFLQKGVLGPDTRVIQTCRNGMCCGDLTRRILKQITE
jgi:hypothetical protein